MITGNASACRAALKSCVAVLERLAYLPRSLAVAAAPDITDLLKSQFAAGVDPYGNRWAPLKPSTLATGRSNPPLTDSRALVNGTKARPQGGNRAGLVIRVGKPYGAFAQTGFRVGRTKVPPRRILPNRGLPAAWREALDRRAREIAAAATKGAR
jgi:hypothetical protein